MDCLCCTRPLGSPDDNYAYRLCAACMAELHPPRRAHAPSVATRCQVYYRDHGRCRYCGEVALEPTFDHVDPDGSDTEANLVTACRRCNSRKGHRTPEAARMRLQLI